MWDALFVRSILAEDFLSCRLFIYLWMLGIFDYTLPGVMNRASWGESIWSLRLWSWRGGIYMFSVSLWHPCRMAQNSREDSQSTLAWLVEKQEETKPQLWWKSQVLTHLQSGDMSVQSWLIILKIWRTNLTMWWKYYSVAENLLFLWKRIIIFGNRDRGQKK